MKKENVVLMQMARESLAGKWGLAIVTCLIYMLAIGAFPGTSRSFPLSGLVGLLIAGPLMLGISIFSLTLARNQEARLEQLFSGFYNFKTALVAYILMLVFIILWMILLIIPGIIAAISYSMTFYIIADDDSIAPMNAIDKSKNMMDGFKWKFFCLLLRFLGWALLCILTLGIGFLWLMPYVQVTIAKFYDDVKANQVNG